MSDCHHRSHRLIEERATGAVGQVWRSFVCNACGEVGVQRAGGMIIEWTGKPVRPNELTDQTVHKALFASRQKGRAKRD